MLPDRHLDAAANPDLTWWRVIVPSNAGAVAAAVHLGCALLLVNAPAGAAAAWRFGVAGSMEQVLIVWRLPR